MKRSFKDPIAEAWRAIHGTSLPKTLMLNEMQRAGQAQFWLNRKGKGRHTLPVCV